jgi:hypothetical protein
MADVFTAQFSVPGLDDDNALDLDTALTGDKRRVGAAR